MRTFALLYQILLWLLYIPAFPLLYYLSLKPKYRRSIPARFFLRKNLPFYQQGIWFHTCSLGETKAIWPLVERLEGPLNFTTTTQTGQEIAKSYPGESRYLPFENLLPLWMKPQKTLVVLEAELWFLLFYLAKRQGTKTILLNARIAEKSFHKYFKNRWLYRRIFAHIDQVYCQSDSDKERLQQLGAKNITVLGNLKILQRPKVTEVLSKPNFPIITAASTHEEEELMVLGTFKKLESNHHLIIAPRHPDRFDKIHQLLQKECGQAGLSYGRYSETKHFKHHVTLVDSLGKLNDIYAISDIVILGGSLTGRYGGHNPIEPAHFGCRLISGPSIFHQIPLFERIENYLLSPPEKLLETIVKIESLPPTYIKDSLNIDQLIKEIDYKEKT